MPLRLVNHAGVYLTAQAFGFRISASNSAAPTKQAWILEQADTDHNAVYLRSCMHLYLATGNVTARAEQRTPECCFLMVAHKYGRCVVRDARAAERWSVHLTVNPRASAPNAARCPPAKTSRGARRRT